MTPTYKKQKQAGVKGHHWETLLGVWVIAICIFSKVRLVHWFDKKILCYYVEKLRAKFHGDLELSNILISS